MLCQKTTSIAGWWDHFLTVQSIEIKKNKHKINLGILMWLQAVLKTYLPKAKVTIIYGHPTSSLSFLYFVINISYISLFHNFIIFIYITLANTLFVDKSWEMFLTNLRMLISKTVSVFADQIFIHWHPSNFTLWQAPNLKVSQVYFLYEITNIHHWFLYYEASRNVQKRIWIIQIFSLSLGHFSDLKCYFRTSIWKVKIKM